MDDLCRNSNVGLCGLTDDDSADYEADWHDHPEDYDEWADE